MLVKHALCDGEAWVFDLHKHVLKNSLNGGCALYIVERVFEARIGCVDQPEFADFGRIEVFKKIDNAFDVGVRMTHLNEVG